MNILKRVNAIISAALNENTSYKAHTLSIEEALNTLNSNDYSQALRSEIAIYRGDRELEKLDGDAFRLLPGLRVSQNTHNYYTKLFSDVLETWKKFPPRNRSFICTNDEYKAERYADSVIFRIFPENNLKIAMCQDNDIWQVSHYFIDLKQFNDYFEYIISRYALKYYIQLDDVFNDYESNDKVYALFDELDKNVRAKYLDGSEPNPLMRYMLELIRDEGTYGMLTKLLQTRVTLYDNIGEVEKDNRSHEIWFSGPCIAVRNNSGILKRLNINAR